MANNRLYIRCKGCGDSTMITKNFGEPYCLDENEVKKLNSFFSDHAFCVDVGYMTIGGRFELFDEFDE